MSSLPGPSAKVPSAVLDALRKAGDLDNLDYNKVSYVGSDGVDEVSIENSATSVSQGVMEGIARSTDGRIQKMLDRQVEYVARKISREARKTLSV